MTKLANSKLFQKLTLLAAFLLPVILFILPGDFFDTGTSICVSKFLLDKECYACGITRAVMHLMHFQFEEAWAFNKLSVIVLPALIFGWVQTIRESLANLKRLNGKQED